MCDAETLTTEVSIVDMAFEPADITIVAGVTVVWKNEGAMPHSVVSRTDDGSIDADGELQGPLLETGDTFDHLFTTPGVYLYRCGPHATMLGSVTVVE
jgi:plastocyanin